MLFLSSRLHVLSRRPGWAGFVYSSIRAFSTLNRLFNHFPIAEVDNGFPFPVIVTHVDAALPPVGLKVQGKGFVIRGVVVFAIPIKIDIADCFGV